MTVNVIATENRKVVLPLLLCLPLLQGGIRLDPSQDLVMSNKLISILAFLSKVVQRHTKRKIRLDTILKKIIKRQLPFLIGGTITGVIMTYYYGFLFSIIVNSAIWMLISFIVNKYYYKSTGFKDEKYLLQYGLAMINTRTRQS
jgi:hypothetical protein